MGQGFTPWDLLTLSDGFLPRRGPVDGRHTRPGTSVFRHMSSLGILECDNRVVRLTFSLRVSLQGTGVLQSCPRLTEASVPYQTFRRVAVCSDR